jgi:hypothetical protein
MKLYRLNLRIIVVVILACYGPQGHAQNKKPNNSLVGTWKLVADQQVDDTGKVILQDKDVDGMLIYTDAGTMSVQFYWRGRRRPIMNDSVMNHDGVSYGLGLGENTWTAKQAKMMIDTYDAYFGSYITDLKNHIVTHLTRGNLRPEKSGTVYKRRFKIEGNNLYLRSVEPLMKWQVWLVRVKS